MAFNLCTSKVATKRLIKVVETRVTGRTTIADERVVERALEGFGEAHITSDEKMGENFLISGVLNYTACFLNAEKQVDSETITIDYSERMNLGESVDALSVMSIIKSSKVTKESEKLLQVTAVIETMVYGVIFEEENFLEAGEDDCFCEQKQVSVSELVASANTNFVVSGNLDDPGLGKIIGAFPFVTINKVTAYDNYALVDGSVTIDYLLANEDQVRKLQKNIDFSEEIPVLNLTSESRLEYVVFGKGITLSKGEGDSIVVDVSIGAGVWGFALKAVNVITDAFSDKSRMSLTYSSVNSIIKQDSKQFSERKTVVVSQQNTKRMDEILFVGPASVETKSVGFVDGVVEIEAVVKSAVAFKNYDQEETVMSDVQESVNLSIPMDGTDGDAMLDVVIGARVQSHKNKAGKEISLTIDFDGVISLAASKVEQYVSNIETLDGLPEQKSSIVVYKPKKNQSVFEIAKELCISPSVLLAQNPQLETGDVSQVVIFKNKK